MPKRKDQRKKFTIEETVRALALWSSRRYQDQFSSADTPNKIFENLSLEMKASGFDRSSYELRKLVQNLTLKYYKKIADRTGSNWTFFRFFHKVYKPPAPNSAIRKLKNDRKEPIQSLQKSPEHNDDAIKVEQIDINDCTEFIDQHELFYESPDTDTDETKQQMTQMIEIESIPIPDTDSDEQQVIEMTEIESIPLPDDHTYHDVYLTAAHLQQISDPADEDQDSVSETPNNVEQDRKANVTDYRVPLSSSTNLGHDPMPKSSVGGNRYETVMQEELLQLQRENNSLQRESNSNQRIIISLLRKLIDVQTTHL